MDVFNNSKNRLNNNTVYIEPRTLFRLRMRAVNDLIEVLYDFSKRLCSNKAEAPSDLCVFTVVHKYTYCYSDLI